LTALCLDLAGDGGFHAAAQVFHSGESDVAVSQVNAFSASCSFCSSNVIGASDSDGGLSRSGAEGGQSSQGTPVESIKKCWESALSPLKTR
jgi:hypothetical protein